MPKEKSGKPEKIVGSYKAEEETKVQAMELAETLNTTLSSEIEKFLERSISKKSFKKS